MSSSTFSSWITSSGGFHFTYTSKISNISLGPYSDCSLNIVHILPSHVYADQYELAQRPHYSFVLQGTHNLELPVGAVDRTDSVLLLKLSDRSNDDEISVDVPLHVRYGEPAPPGHPGYNTIALKLPFGLWACSSTGILHRPITEFDSIPQFVIHSLSEHNLEVISTTTIGETTLKIPVGMLSDVGHVDIVTAGVMLVMSLYLALVSYKTARRLAKAQHAPVKTE